MKKIECHLKQYNDVVYLSDDPDYLRERKKEGKAVILLLTEDNRTADFSSFPYALEVSISSVHTLKETSECEISCVPKDLEDIMDIEYLERVLLRYKHQPLTIAENDRLRIREISREDGTAIAELFDKEGAGKYLDDFGWDPEEIETELSEYIKTAYDISDYGIWAVCRKQEGMNDFRMSGEPELENKDGSQGGNISKSDGRSLELTDNVISSVSLQSKEVSEELIGIVSLQSKEVSEELIGIVSLQPRELTDVYEKTDLDKTKEIIFAKLNSLSIPNNNDIQNTTGGKELLELGFALLTEFQRHGYGYEMCQLLLRHFSQDNRCFIAHTDERNTASVMLLQKLGFKSIVKTSLMP